MDMMINAGRMQKDEVKIKEKEYQVVAVVLLLRSRWSSEARVVKASRQAQM